MEWPSNECYLFTNLDWDPSYLALLFSKDFENMSSLWNCELVSDVELLEFSKNEEKYSPCVEDISLDDDMLLNAVNQIEAE